MTRRLLNGLGVRPGEGRRVAWMTLYAAAAIGGVATLGNTASDSLCLGSLPPDRLPLIFMATGAVGAVTFFLYGAAAGRISQRRLVIGSDLILLGCALTFWLLIPRTGVAPLAVLLSLSFFMDIGASLVIAQFWVIAAQNFDSRQAKRLFGLISAGGTLGGMGISLAIILGLARFVGVPNLILLVASSLAICLACALAMGRTDPLEQGSPPVEETRAPLGADLRAMLRSPLLWLVGGLTVLVALLVNTGCYQFFRAVQGALGSDSERIASFYGVFGLGTLGVALAVQLLLTSRIMRRYGIQVALLLFPVATALGGVLALVTGGAFPAMVLIRAGDPILRSTINQSALTALYLPVPSALRPRARVLVEILYSASFSLLGLLFLVTQDFLGWSWTAWSWPLIGFAVAWVLVLVWGWPHYKRALDENFRRRRLDREGTAIDYSEPATLRVLTDALRGTDERLVVHTLGLLDDATGVDWRPHVAPLLRHRSPQVRVLVLRHLASAGPDGLSDEIVEGVSALLATRDDGVRASAVEALSALAGPTAVARIEALLSEPSLAVRSAAIVLVWRHGGPKQRQSALDAMKALLDSRDSSHKAEGARLVGLLAPADASTLLAPLLRDENPHPAPGPDRPRGASWVEPQAPTSVMVRQAAVRAVGALGILDLLPRIVPLLADHRMRSAAMEALVVMGPGHEDALATFLVPGAMPPAARVRIPTVLGRIATRAAAEILATYIDEEDESLHLAVILALVHLRDASVEIPIPALRLHRRTLLEIEDVYRHFVVEHDLGTRCGPLLAEAVRVLRRRALRRVFGLLELSHPSHRIPAIQQAMSEGESRDRAAAIELLDTLLDADTRALLIPLVDAMPEEVRGVARERLGIVSRSTVERLGELMASSDPWIRACTVLHTQSNPHGGCPMTLSTMERVLFLKGVGIFSALDGEDLEPLARCASEVRFREGTTFIRQGEPGTCLYVIVDGTVDVRSAGTRVGARGVGEVIGDMAVLLRRPRSADCVAQTEVLALLIRHDDFWDLMADRPGLATGIIKVLATRLDEATGRMRRATLMEG